MNEVCRGCRSKQTHVLVRSSVAECCICFAATGLPAAFNFSQHAEEAVEDGQGVRRTAWDVEIDR